MRTESADYRAGFAAGRDDARSQIDELCDENYRLETERDALTLRAQSLEASLVLVEDQRDNARVHNTALTTRIAELEAVAYALMERVDGNLAAVTGERDAARAELEALRQSLRDATS